MPYRNAPLASRVPLHRAAFVLVMLTCPWSAMTAQSHATMSIAPGVRIGAEATGAAGAVLDSSDVTRAAALTFSELLQARLASVSVMMNDGTLNGGGRFLIRGPTSIVTGGAPMLVVDGMPMANEEDDRYATASRLDDIAVADIATVEVLRGPAAATLYGAGATAGVIVVTTKRGAEGHVRSHSRVMTDSRADAGGYADSYRGVSAPTSTSVRGCDLRTQAEGACRPTSLDRWNLLDASRPFSTGLGVLATTDISAGTTSHDARFSVDVRRANGIAPDDRLSRIGSRLNVSQRFGHAAELTARAGFHRDGGVGSAAGDVITAAYMNRMPADSAGAFGRTADSLLYQDGRDQELRHVTLGAELAAHPASWLAVRAAISRDRVDEHALRSSVNGVVLGERRHVAVQTLNASRGTAELTHSVAGASSVLVLGAERQVHTGDWQDFDRVTLRSTDADSRYIQSTLGDPTTMDTERHWGGSTNRALFASERLSFGDVATAGMGVRREQDGSIDQQWRLHPTADVSVRVAKTGALTLRARAAYGESAQPYALSEPTRPMQVVPNTYYGTAPVVPALAPLELTREREAGLDFSMGSRAQIQATVYSRRSNVLMSLNAGPATGGFFSSVDNARIDNHGVELDARVRVVDRASLRWELRAIGASQSNRLSATGDASHNDALLRDGLAVWSASRRYRYSDANGDGIIAWNEKTYLGDRPETHPSTPTFEGALHSALSFGRRVSVNAVLDRRSGFWSSEQSTAMHCSFGLCQWISDPSTPLDLQAAVTAFSSIVEDASFTRLRELSLRWNVASSTGSALGSRDVAIVLAGRDLFTWTSWHGLDPEINTSTRRAVIHDDLNGVPLPRRVMVGVELGY